MKVKKIQEKRRMLVRACNWCNGAGYDSYLSDTCYICKGTGGKWRNVWVTVGRVIEK